jgi:hypothetical protein
MNKFPDMNENSEPGCDGDEAPHPGIEMLRAPQAPQRDLWPDIEARLAPGVSPIVRRSRWRQSVWLAAAGFTGTALLAAAILSQRPHRDVDSASVAALRASAEVAAATLPAQDAAIQPVAMVRPVHPESRALVKANLKLVNSAEVQVRKAMQSDPDAAYLQSLLATAHQQKKSLQVALSDDGD